MPGTFPFTFDSGHPIPAGTTTEPDAESWTAWVRELIWAFLDKYAPDCIRIGVMAGRKRKAAEMDEIDETTPARIEERAVTFPTVQYRSYKVDTSRMSMSQMRKLPRSTTVRPVTLVKPIPMQQNILGASRPFAILHRRKALERESRLLEENCLLEQNRLLYQSRLWTKEQNRLCANQIKDFHVKSNDPKMTRLKYEHFKSRHPKLPFKDDELQYLFECIQNKVSVQVSFTEDAYPRAVELLHDRNLHDLEPYLYNLLAHWVNNIHPVQATRSDDLPLPRNSAHQAAQSAATSVYPSRQATESVNAMPAPLATPAHDQATGVATAASAPVVVHVRDTAADKIPLPAAEEDPAPEEEDVAAGKNVIEAEKVDALDQLRVAIDRAGELEDDFTTAEDADNGEQADRFNNELVEVLGTMEGLEAIAESGELDEFLDEVDPLNGEGDAKTTRRQSYAVQQGWWRVEQLPIPGSLDMAIPRNS